MTRCLERVTGRRCLNRASFGEWCHTHRELQLTELVVDHAADDTWNAAINTAAKELDTVGAGVLAVHIRGLLR